MKKTITQPHGEFETRLFWYDLRTNLKFVGSAWIDNGYKTTKLSQTLND